MAVVTAYSILVISETLEEEKKVSEQFQKFADFLAVTKNIRHSINVAEKMV